MISLLVLIVVVVCLDARGVGGGASLPTGSPMDPVHTGRPKIDPHPIHCQIVGEDGSALSFASRTMSTEDDAPGGITPRGS